MSRDQKKSERDEKYEMNPDIRFDPIGGDEVWRFPAGVPLRREGSPSMKVFSWPERDQVAEKGEFRHTVLGTYHFGMI